MRSATPAWGCVAVAALAATAMHPANPAVSTLVGACAVGIVVLGVRLHSPMRPQVEHAGRVEPWLLLATGLLMFVVGDGVRLDHRAAEVATGFPGTPDLVLVGAAITTVLAFFGLVRDRFPDQAPEWILEAGLVAGGASLAGWVLGRGLADAGLSDASEAMVAVLTALLVCVVWLAVWPVTMPSPQRPSDRLLLAGSSLVVAVHAAVVVGVLGGPAPADRAVGIGAISGYLLLAAAAVHPSRSTWTDPPAALVTTRLRRRQIAVLSVIGLTGPVLLVVAGVASVDIDLPTMGAGLAAISGLGVGYLTRLVHARERVEWRAHHDELTGLPNRTVYNDRLSLALSHARRSGGSLAVMFLDLDRFKAVNDSLGHAEGNRLLQAASKRLQQCLREEDTIARFGGDEFAVLLPEIDGAHDAIAVADKLLGAFAAPFELADRELFVTTSIGVALYPSDGVEADLLVRNADAAMYRAKERGRNGVHLYSREINLRLKERAALEAALRGAVDRDELVLHYQPKIEVVSGRTVGVEALVRWRHPERGLLGPDEFIPIAEDTGLIGEVGEWVLEQACREIREWQRAGLPELTVSVNVSPRQLRDHRLTDVVARVLRETGLPARFLELELTENVAIEAGEQTVEMLNDLRRMGVQCCIDDFGMGYSSLSYLTRLPIERLKIDRTFVARIGPDGHGDDAAIVRAVIVLAHSLGLQVIAEGVDTPEQLAFLEQHGCDLMQGFLFSKPVSNDKVAELLRGERDRPPGAVPTDASALTTSVD